MIRILQMIGSLNVGGSQTMIMNIYRNIDRTKMQFDFVLDHPDETYFAEDIKALGGRIFTMPVFKGTNAGEIKRDWNNFFYTHPEYHVLHSHVRSYASLYLPVAAKHGVKTIIHSHSTSNGSGITAKMKDMLQLPLRDQADILMACSSEAGKWLFGEEACRSNKYIFLPNAVDLRRFSMHEDARKKYRRDMGLEDKLVIGHVGRFLNAKNHSFLLDVFAKVHEKKPDSVLLLIGDGGSEKQHVIDKACELGIAESVLLSGNRSDVPELMSTMDVFVFPSLWEGMPATVIEAQAAGLPCLISDTITTDVDISPLVKRLPLDDAGIWAEEVLKERGRQDVSEDIIRSGFEIHSSVDLLTGLYTRLDREAGSF